MLKYCAIALQAAVEDKLRQNTIKKPEFSAAVKERDAEKVYEVLKALNMRNAKRQNRWRHGLEIIQFKS